jgi:hypothetical protein
VRVVGYMRGEHLEWLSKACFPLRFESLCELIGMAGSRLRACNCANVNNHVVFKIFIICNQCISPFIFEADAMALVYAIEVLDSCNDGVSRVMSVD